MLITGDELDFSLNNYFYTDNHGKTYIVGLSVIGIVTDDYDK